MKTSRQLYKDAKYDEALAAGCDVVQLKYDGWWARIEIEHGKGQVFSETGRHLPRFDFTLVTAPLTLTLVGELMYGTQWAKDPGREGKIFLFDCWRYEEKDTEAYSYRDRFALIKSLQPHLPLNFEKVQNYKIGDYTHLWKELVETKKFEGVVFRNSKHPAGAPLMRHKNVFTEDVRIVGFKAGNGKHAGRLGSLLCTTIAGYPIDIGGGLDDAARDEIWRNQDSYLGRYAQIEGRARFTSGALRHPNLVALRPEGWAP